MFLDILEATLLTPHWNIHYLRFLGVKIMTLDLSYLKADGADKMSIEIGLFNVMFVRKPLLHNSLHLFKIDKCFVSGVVAVELSGECVVFFVKPECFFDAHFFDGVFLSD